VLTARSSYVSLLQQELIARNSSYAALNFLPHVTSYGELPVVVYQQSECGRHHGNFISASYRAILRSPEWRKRLQKVRSQGRRSLPARNGSWRELDSSLSSDALLMNIFCYPGVTRRTEVCRILGLEPGDLPEFGFMPRVPLLSEATERTEIDMKLGNMLFEAKLTEADFQIQRADLVERVAAGDRRRVEHDGRDHVHVLVGGLEVQERGVEPAHPFHDDLPGVFRPVRPRPECLAN